MCARKVSNPNDMSCNIGGVALVVLCLASCTGDEPAAQPRVQVSTDVAADGPVVPMGQTCDGRAPVAPRQEPDYPDWVHLNGQYYFPRDAPVGVVPTRVIAKVRCQLIGSRTRPDYRPQDGDATSLPAGTRILAVAGRPVEEMVATRDADGLWVWVPEETLDP